jgi:hypothetical protein
MRNAPLASTLTLGLACLLAACVGQVEGGGSSPAPDAAIGPLVDGAPGATDARPGSVADAGSQPQCYSEPVYPNANIADIVSTYGGANWKDELIEAMSRRHPATSYLLAQQRDDSYFDQFSDSSSWTNMVGWLDTLSHEETHLFNAYHAQQQGQVHALFHRPDLIYYLPTDPGFPRGEIWDDITQAARDGIYAPTYLQGTQGQRGFNELLDEHNCYLNEVAAVGSVGEHFQGGVSLRDGSAAFLYFIETYLRVARTEYPQIYAQLAASAVYRDAVETAWLRTHFFLELADNFPNLGINDAMYRDLAHQPANMAEIEMFIGKPVNASACLP